MSLTFDFKGKHILITGATRGIGAAIAKDFFNAGANLILTGADQGKIDFLNETNKENQIKNIQYIQADFSDDGSFNKFLLEVKKYGRIDICINNAGINRLNFVDRTRREDFELLTKVNLRAPFMICRQLCHSMKRSNYGRIINIASIWSIITKEQRSIYTTTKSGIVGMTKTLAVELAPYNILVNAISPGFTMTELTKATNTEKEINDITSQIPINRLAQPEEISKVVLFLASDLNTYITGQNIIADGGFSIV
jgi:3-oxoacyl-[acyl-carrier protein] reductase